MGCKDLSDGSCTIEAAARGSPCGTSGNKVKAYIYVKINSFHSEEQVAVFYDL